MKVLVLGGTGSMGDALIRILCKEEIEIFVTSRARHDSFAKNVHFIQGNARNEKFLDEILKARYEVIVDFMRYNTEEFKRRVDKLLSSTEHYFYLSSARVYADAGYSPITENAPRLLDVCKDVEYLKTDEYALMKARQENILKESRYKNWTIIRPYITYNHMRLQLGFFEVEFWLRRLLEGKTIIFANDLAHLKTTLTYAYDVSGVIAELVRSKKGLGEIIQIADSQSIEWKAILDIYLEVLSEKEDIRPKVKWVDNLVVASVVSGREYQLKCDRYYNRIFDSKKADAICGYGIEYTDTVKGLKECLEQFLQGSRQFRQTSWRLEGYVDRITGEKTPLCNIDDVRDKVKYIIYRYTPYAKLIERFNIKKFI